MAGEPLDRLEIQISSSSTDAAKKVDDLAAALDRLKKSARGVSEKSSKSDIQKVGKDADKSVKLSKKTVEQIEALSRATQSINSKAGHGMKELAGGLRALASVREVKIPKSLADNIANLGAAIDLIDDGISEKAIKFSSALGTLAGAGKINISTKLPDRMLDIGAAMDLISDDAIRRLDSMTASLQRLSGVDLKGLPAALREVAKSKGPTGLDMAKVDASIEKTKATIDDLKSKYEALQSVQGKGNQETQARNAAELAKVSALLEEQQRLYDSLIEKKKKYADAGVGRDENLSGTGEVQTRAVEEVTQRVGLLQRALAWVRQEWSLFDAAALKATSEGTASLERMKKSIFDNATAWSKIRSSASSAFDGVKEKIAAAAVQSQKFATALKIGIPVIGTIVSVLRGLVGIVGKLVSGVLQFARTLAGAAFNGVKKLASGLKSIGSHVLNYVTKPFQRAIGFIENFKKKLVSVAFYRLVRTALKMITDGFKEGIENLYYFSSLTESQFKPAMDSLASSSLYLKNSLGAMAAPLIQAVAPAVNYLIDLFVTLLNVINMVFSVLGGRTYTKALKTSAKYADDLDKSLGGGAASAKELQRYLIGIDQLTIMPDEPNSGGGGGGGDLLSDYEDMFEEVPLPDWVLNIKDAIAAGDWAGAGELLAEKLNGIIDNFDAASWGTKIGKKIQGGLEFFMGFVDNLHIEGLGGKVATLIGNALNEIKGETIGGVLAEGIKSAFRFLEGFVAEYKGPNIGTYLADIVNGWFKKIGEVDENGESGWKRAGKLINDGIISVIDGVGKFIDGLETGTISQSFNDFFGEIDWPGIWDAVKRLAKTAAGKVDWLGILDSLWRFAANVLVFLRTKVLGIPYNQASQPWKDLEDKLSNASARINWADIISGLIAFIGDIITTIKDAFPEGGWEEIWNNVKDSLSEALGFDSWKDLKGELSEKVIGVLKSAIDMVEQAVYEHLKSGGWFQQSMASYLFPEKYHIDVASSTFENNLGNGLSSAFENAWGAAKRAGMSEKEFLSWVESLTGTLYGSVDDVFAAAKAGLIDPVQDAFNQIDTMDKDVDVTVDATTSPEFDNVKDQIHSINDKTAILKAEARNPYEEKLREIGKTFEETNDKSAQLKITVKDATKNVRETAIEAWELLKNKSVSLKAKVVDMASNVRTTMLSAWETIKDKASTLRASVVDGASSVRQTILNAWDKIKDKVATLTAKAENASSGVFSNLTGLWDALKDKIVTLTGKGATDSSLGATKSAFDSISSKTVKVTVDGSMTNTFGQAKRDYQLLQNKTVTVTYNAKGTAISGAQATAKAMGGIFSGGSWHDIAGYAGGGSPKRARLFFANENGIPELIGRIGSNTAVMNNGQIVASVSSGVYRAVSAAMGGIGNYFANIATSMSRIPEVLSNITPVQPQPIVVGAGGPTYEMDMGKVGRTNRGDIQRGGAEDQEEIINAIYAMGQRIITAINSKDSDVYLDGWKVGSSTTDVQNRQNRMYGKTLQNV